MRGFPFLGCVFILVKHDSPSGALNWTELHCGLDREGAGTLSCQRIYSRCVLGRGLWSSQKMEQKKTKGQVIQTKFLGRPDLPCVAWVSVFLHAVTNVAKSIHRCHGTSMSYNQPSVFSQQQNKFHWEKSLLIKTNIVGTNIIVMS